MRTCCSVVVVVLACLACGEPGVAPGPAGGGGAGGSGGGLDLAERLAAGQVRGGRIDAPAELLSGPETRGKLGDFKLYNDRVAFVIEDARSSNGYCPFGGGVLDADRIRPAGEPAVEPFEELIFAWDQRAFAPESVVVVNDGSDGAPAHLRATGRDESFPLLDVVFQTLLGSVNKPLGLRVTLDYVLRPDADDLEVTATLFNDGEADVEVGAMMLGILNGSGAKLYYPGHGAQLSAASTPQEWVASTMPGLSWLIFSPGERFQPALTYQGLSLGSVGGLQVPARGSAGRGLRIVLGDGSVTDLLAKTAALAGSDAVLAPLTGLVTAGGAPVEGARVHLEDASLPDFRSYHGFALTGADGRFTAQLPPGSYRLAAVADGRAASAVVELTLPAAGAEQDLTVGEQGGLRVAAVDEAGAPLPVKVVVTPVAPAVALPDAWGEPPLPRGAAAIVFADTGSAGFPLPPGSYDVLVARGFEYELQQETVEVAAGATAEVTAQLPRVVDTTGWLSGDFHLHAALSPDSEDPYPHKVRSFAAEGLEVPVNTEHEVIGDYGPTIRELGLSEWLFSIVGEEVSTIPFGHWNSFPLAYDEALPNNGAIVWYGQSMREVLDSVRAQPTSPVVQMNHPRSGTMKGYFTMIGFDSGRFAADDPDPDDFVVDFDAMEIMNGGSVGEADRVSEDWYAFLNRGYRITGTGTSDSHASTSDEPGFPRTYMRSSTDFPAEADEGELIAAVRGGNCTVSSGLFVTASIGGKGPGETATVAGGTVRVDVEVQAPTWMGPVASVEVIVNGAVVATVPVPAEPPQPGRPALRFSAPIDVPVPLDGWLVVKARAPQGTLRPVIESGEPPHGFADAIWLDADGDGTITPPIAP